VGRRSSRSRCGALDRPPGGRRLRLDGRRGTSLRARRGGRHSARRAPIEGPSPAPGRAAGHLPPRPSRRASFSAPRSLRAGRFLSVAFAAPTASLAAVPTWPAALAQLVRPPPDGRSARYPTTRPGAARVVGVDELRGIHPGCPSETRGCRCSLVGRVRPCLDTARRAGRGAGYRAERGSGGGRDHSTGTAGQAIHRPEGTPPEHAPASLRKLRARKRRGGAAAARRRVARSRGAPQRGRRAEDSAQKLADRRRQPSAVGVQRTPRQDSRTDRADAARSTRR
jgi:hypothetical protein